MTPIPSKTTGLKAIEEHPKPVSYEKEPVSGLTRIWSFFQRQPLYRYGIASILVSGLILFTYFRLSPSPTWSFMLLAAIASILGALLSLIAAARSDSADRKATKLLKELEETQRIVGESPTHYPQVFAVHLLDPLDEARQHGSLRRMELLISTPAYGYHVLGIHPHLEFRNALMDLHCEKNIIFFTPDTHFFHVANTLLWHPLAKQRIQSSDVNVATSKGNDLQQDNPDVNPRDLANCINDTMAALRPIVSRTENSGDIKVNLWATNSAPFRLSAFQFERDTRAFLVLTDHVTLSSDLSEFRGRAMALPSSLHRHVMGDRGDPNSFFEQLKTCPYSLRVGDAARLASSEFDPLTYDYLFLRTARSLFDLSFFETECRQIISTMRKEQPAVDYYINSARSVLRGVVEYFVELTERAIPLKYIPSESIQQKRLTVAKTIQQKLENENWTDSREALDLLQQHSLDPNDPFVNDSKIYVEHIKQTDPSQEPVALWLSCIYYFLSSGFGQSLFAMNRRPSTKKP